jgi:hypothetical protein
LIADALGCDGDVAGAVGHRMYSLYQHWNINIDQRWKA